MTTEVNKVISELYGALVGFPSNEEKRFQKNYLKLERHQDR